MPFLDISPWIEDPNKIILTDINGVEYTVQDVLDFIAATNEAVHVYYLEQSGEVFPDSNESTS